MSDVHVRCHLRALAIAARGREGCNRGPPPGAPLRRREPLSWTVCRCCSSSSAPAPPDVPRWVWRAARLQPTSVCLTIPTIPANPLADHLWLAQSSKRCAALGRPRSKVALTALVTDPQQTASTSRTDTDADNLPETLMAGGVISGYTTPASRNASLASSFKPTCRRKAVGMQRRS